MHDVISELERLRRHSRQMLVSQRLAVMLAWFVASTLAMILVDYALRLPGGLRLLLLVAGLAALGWATGRYLRAAVLYAPDLTQLALRLERWLPALSGRLASSVEFAIAGDAHTNPLAARCVRETQRRLKGESLMKVIAPARTLRAVGALAGAGVVAAGLALTFPAGAQTGLHRVFLPMGGAVWPARTGVQSLMFDVIGEKQVFPRGRALPLRAQVTRGEPDQRVTARYRLHMNENFGPWQTILLTHQADGVHERLIDSNAEAAAIQFLTEDARTPIEIVKLVEPPEVRRSTLRVTPPAYAADSYPPLLADLGTGTDGRSNHGAVFTGRVAG